MDMDKACLTECQSQCWYHQEQQSLLSELKQIKCLKVDYSLSKEALSNRPSLRV